MEGIILDCLEKAPERRPRSVRELSERIEAAFAGESHSLARPGGTAMHRRACRRSPRRRQRPVRMRPDGPQLLPEGGGVPRAAATQPAPATTLRGATGERATLDDNPGEGNLGATGRRGWRRPVVGMALVVALAAIWCGCGRPGTAPVRGVRFGGGARGGRRPPLRQLPQRAQPRTISRAPRTAHARPRSRRQRPPRGGASRTGDSAPGCRGARRSRHLSVQEGMNTTNIVGAKTPPEPEHKAGAKPPGATKPPPSKPNCSPNFYFDAQGDKHFKPECF